MHGIASHKRTAFGSRLKHLQKLGLPVGDRPGKGRAGAYSLSQLMQMAAALEMIQSGLNPAYVAKLIQRYWWLLQLTIFPSTFADEELAAWFPERAHREWLWLFHPNALAELVDGSDSRSEERLAGILTVADVRELLLEVGDDDLGSASRRMIVIKATPLTREVMHKLDRLGFLDPQDFQDGFATSLKPEVPLIKVELNLSDDDGAPGGFRHLLDFTERHLGEPNGDDQEA
jgi:CBS domain-containing protein